MSDVTQLRTQEETRRDIARALGERIAQYVIRCIEFKDEETAQGACRVVEFVEEALPGVKAAYIEEMKKCPT